MQYVKTRMGMFEVVSGPDDADGYICRVPASGVPFGVVYGKFKYYMYVFGKDVIGVSEDIESLFDGYIVVATVDGESEYQYFANERTARLTAHSCENDPRCLVKLYGAIWLDKGYNSTGLNAVALSVGQASMLDVKHEWVLIA